MEWEPTRTKIAQGQVKKGTVRAKWISQEIINKRRENRQCYRCGSSSHRVAQCYLLPAERLVSIKKVAPEIEDARNVETNASYDEDLDSGKE